MLARHRRAAGARRLRRARRRGDGRGDPRARARRRCRSSASASACRSRSSSSRATCCGLDDSALERVRAGVRQPRHLADGVAAARHRHGRHDAARRVSLPARARIARPPRSTACPRSASAIAIATRCRTRIATCSSQHGLRLSGLSPDGSLVEIIELANHPWFIGCQFHPELQSRPTRPHPLFAGFIAAAAGAEAARRRRGRGAVAGRSAPTDVTVRRFPRDALFLIAGPCVLEDDALNLRVGEHLARLARARARRHHLQGELRQGQPLERRRASRAWPRRRARARSTACARATGLPHAHRRASPRAVRAGRARSSTCCRSRRSSAGRPTCSSPRARRASR